MCLHFFAYYPRIPSFYTCVNVIVPQAWIDFANDSSFVPRIGMFAEEEDDEASRLILDSPSARRLSVSGWDNVRGLTPC